MRFLDSDWSVVDACSGVDTVEWSQGTVVSREVKVILCQGYLLRSQFFKILRFKQKNRGAKFYLTERNSFDQYANGLRGIFQYLGLYLFINIFGISVIANSKDILKSSPRLFRDAQVIPNPRFDEKDIQNLTSLSFGSRSPTPTLAGFFRWADQKNPDFVRRVADSTPVDVDFKVFCNESDHHWQYDFVDPLLELSRLRPIVFLCSKYEGLPNIIIEALALNCPVVVPSSMSGLTEFESLSSELVFCYEQNDLASFWEAYSIAAKYPIEQKVNWHIVEYFSTQNNDIVSQFRSLFCYQLSD